MTLLQRPSGRLYQSVLAEYICTGINPDPSSAPVLKINSLFCTILSLLCVIKQSLHQTTPFTQHSIPKRLPHDHAFLCAPLPSLIFRGDAGKGFVPAPRHVQRE